MQPTDRGAFKALLTDAMAFWRTDLSTFALGVWWEACKTFELEQVSKAITAHAMDPEQGRFKPMPADIVKQLQGTRTDRSLIAWGKVMEAMQSVGSWGSVTFDDPAIHAAIEDMGGWPMLCRSKTDELAFVQRRFCDTHKAYSVRPNIPHVPVLRGGHDQQNAANGYALQQPVLIGDPERAQAIAHSAGVPRVQISLAVASVTDLKRIGNAA